MREKKPTLAIHRRRIAQFSLIEALRRKGGSVSAACEEVGISRQTHYNWYREDAHYRDLVDRLIEELEEDLNRWICARIRTDFKERNTEEMESELFVYGKKLIDRILAGENITFNYIKRHG